MIPHLDYTDTLLLDVDGGETTEDVIRRRAERLGLEVDWVDSHASKSLNKHFFVKLRNPVSIDQVPILQALLGSDVKRECLIYRRIKHGTYMNVFFSKAYQVGIPVKVGKNPSELIKWFNCVCGGFLELIRLWGFSPDSLIRGVNPLD